jgi:polyadenylate-binding protein
MTPQSLKENLDEFLKMDREKQRTILGELLFPLVKKVAEEESIAPKITGMLIDFEVFDVSDILEFLDNEEQLRERVSEAEELIKQSSTEEQK